MAISKLRADQKAKVKGWTDKLFDALHRITIRSRTGSTTSEWRDYHVVNLGECIEQTVELVTKDGIRVRITVLAWRGDGG